MRPLAMREVVTGAVTLRQCEGRITEKHSDDTRKGMHSLSRPNRCREELKTHAGRQQFSECTEKAFDFAPPFLSIDVRLVSAESV